MRMIRSTSLALIFVLVLVPAMASLAAEGPEPDPDIIDPAPQPGPADEELEGIPGGYEAAVPVEEAAPADSEQPWTTKFLVPTGLLIAAIAIFATVVMYFVRVVRTRYKVVE